MTLTRDDSLSFKCYLIPFIPFFPVLIISWHICTNLQCYLISTQPPNECKSYGYFELSFRNLMTQARHCQETKWTVSDVWIIVFLQVPLACLGSMAEGSWAGTSVQLWENSFQTSLCSSFCLLVCSNGRSTWNFLSFFIESPGGPLACLVSFADGFWKRRFFLHAFRDRKWDRLSPEATPLSSCNFRAGRSLSHVRQSALPLQRPKMKLNALAYLSFNSSLLVGLLIILKCCTLKWYLNLAALSARLKDQHVWK